MTVVNVHGSRFSGIEEWSTNRNIYDRERKYEHAVISLLQKLSVSK